MKDFFIKKFMSGSTLQPLKVEKFHKHTSILFTEQQKSMIYLA